MTKVCIRCDKTKPISDFNKGDRELLTCAPCREYARANNHKNRRLNPEKVRSENLWSFYRIRPAEYDAHRQAQDYRCAICGTPESEVKVRSKGRPRLDGTPNAEPFRLVVDHCHDSRKVRGLLCTDCNIGLGLFKDSPERLMAAARYLLGREPSTLALEATIKP